MPTTESVAARTATAVESNYAVKHKARSPLRSWLIGKAESGHRIAGAKQRIQTAGLRFHLSNVHLLTSAGIILRTFRSVLLCSLVGEPLLSHWYSKHSIGIMEST